MHCGSMIGKLKADIWSKFLTNFKEESWKYGNMLSIWCLSLIDDWISSAQLINAVNLIRGWEECNSDCMLWCELALVCWLKEPFCFFRCTLEPFTEELESLLKRNPKFKSWCAGLSFDEGKHLVGLIDFLFAILSVSYSCEIANGELSNKKCARRNVKERSWFRISGMFVCWLQLLLLVSIG